jgi:26S proteasome regulatory subunit N8
MTIYLSSLVRAITAFHDLIENKIQNKQQEEDKEHGNHAKPPKEETVADKDKKPTETINGEAKAAGDKTKDKEKPAKK